MTDFQINDFVIPKDTKDLFKNLTGFSNIKSLFRYGYELEIEEENLLPHRVACIYKPNNYTRKNYLILDNGNISYPILLESSNAKLVFRSEFKVGDQVQLTKTPEIGPHKAPGWQGSKHFLKKGSKAIIHSIEYNGHYNRYSYQLIFNDESWIDLAGFVRPIKEKDKHVYNFSENYIEKITTNTIRGI